MIHRTVRNAAVAALSGLAVGIAVAALGGDSRSTGDTAGRSLYDTLVLMQYGFGALGETNPPDTGDLHARNTTRRD